MSTRYKDHGYKNREGYLVALADDLGFDLESQVRPLADLLGPNEDFDGLVCALQDLDAAERRKE